MPDRNARRRHYEETFKRAAVEFQGLNGHTPEQAAAELGVDPAELESWKKKSAGRSKSAKSCSGMARLRAENEALRNQILALQVQWDILRTTLGVLSTTVGSRDVM